MSISAKSPTKSPPLSLQGFRILVTRAADQAEEFCGLLRQRGAVAIECPTIQLVPPLSWDALDAALDDPNGFEWLILTSVNGVRFFFERLAQRGSGPEALRGIKVCAVGPKTAEALAERGVTVDLLPQQFTGEGIVAAFQGMPLQGKRILFPRAEAARDLVPQQLRGLGAVLLDPVVYRTTMPLALPVEACQALERHRLDAVIFSSPLTARNLAALVGGADRLQELLSGVVIASIGPVTSQACRELGLAVAVEPPEATLSSLLQALEAHFTQN